VRKAARWYERQRPGLGRDFVSEVDAALNRVVENPYQYQVLHRDARRAIVRRFPYGAFYRIEGDKIIVFCVDRPSARPSHLDGPHTEVTPNKRIHQPRWKDARW
jgi:plasmid stabilization system protein ParE